MQAQNQWEEKNMLIATHPSQLTEIDNEIGQILSYDRFVKWVEMTEDSDTVLGMVGSDYDDPICFYLSDVLETIDVITDGFKVIVGVALAWSEEMEWLEKRLPKELKDVYDKLQSRYAGKIVTRKEIMDIISNSGAERAFDSLQTISQ
jgi:hypothetical protein